MAELFEDAVAVVDVVLGEGLEAAEAEGFDVVAGDDAAEDDGVAEGGGVEPVDLGEVAGKGAGKTADTVTGGWARLATMVAGRFCFLCFVIPSKTL